ncbi:MAG: glutamate racemase [Myxococcota bacterium]|jgi:glutamate racemase
MIGVFDSGFGGLTILRELLRGLPGYDYLYLGDTARAPYGARSPQVIHEWTRDAVDYLFRQGCTLVVLACFSASANALRRLQMEWLPGRVPPLAGGSGLPGRRVLGVLVPLAEEADRISKTGRIGIMATRATVNSGVLAAEMQKRRSNLEITSQAAPLLVPLIEEGWAGRPETRSILREYLDPFKKAKIDTLLLACTHYPLLYAGIVAEMGEGITVINPGEIVADSLVRYLMRHPELDCDLSKNGTCSFLTTDRPSEFEKLGSAFLGRPFKAGVVKY